MATHVGLHATIIFFNETQPFCHAMELNVHLIKKLNTQQKEYNMNIQVFYKIQCVI